MRFLLSQKKIHIDIDPSSINKNVEVDLAIVGDVRFVLERIILTIKTKYPNLVDSNKQGLSLWWKQIETWRKKKFAWFFK